MVNDMYKEEKKYLDFVNDCIQEELLKASKHLEELKKQKVTYDDAKRGEQFTKDAMIRFYTDRIARLKQVMNSPYFGRMDFTASDTSSKQKVYVGKTTISSDNSNLAVIDWRSPISSMYYDSSLGNASYLSPSGLIEGVISLKRQIVIEDAILKSILDSDLVTNDDILQEYLDIHADNKMKNIVASIQKEQNAIIRKNINQNIIIQGVAGSGKTSVALHRIAYLLYTLNNSTKKVGSDQFLIIGPNNCFLDYISGVLPDLDVGNVNQTTVTDLVLNLVGEKFKVLDSTSELQEFYKNRSLSMESSIKNSLQFELAIDKYISELLNSYKENDIICYDKVLFTKDMIESIIEGFNGNYRFNIMELEKKLIQKVKSNYDKYYDLLIKDIKKEAFSLPLDSEKRKLLLEKATLIEKELKTGMTKQIKKHFSNITKDILQHYITFIKTCDKYLTDIDTDYFKKQTISRLSKKTISRDDIAPILYFKSKLDQISEFNKTLHVVIDEAQDLGLLEFKVLKTLMPNATFSIFGDLNQAIFSYRTVNDWNIIRDKVFDENCEIINMEQSYRTTNEIMMEANKISKYLTGTISRDIIRHGNDVEYILCDKDNEIEYLINNIKKYQQAGYKSIAIICKTEKTSEYINNKLKEQGIDIINVSSNDRQYQGGVCTITCGLAKGLEFDATILIGVNSKNYNPEYDIDMKLLYVGMTRALHDVSVIYNDRLPSILENEKKLTKVKRK